jgi:hypothetical protein
MPPTSTTIHKASAAKPIRQMTMVKTGSSRTATPVKKNEPPQHIDNSSSMPHTSGVMASVFGAAPGAAVIWLLPEPTRYPSNAIASRRRCNPQPLSRKRRSGLLRRLRLLAMT